MGYDTTFELGTCIFDYTIRKKNLGFWMKCGIEINKEIKGNEAEK